MRGTQRRPRTLAPAPPRPRAGALLASLLALVLLLGLAACGADENGEGETSSSSTRASNDGADDVMSRVRAATVAIAADDGNYHSHGTGVIYDAKEGLVVTSGHVVDNARSLKLTIGEKQEAKARYVARAQCEDIAVLKIDERFLENQSGLTALELANSDTLQAGSRVRAFGYSGLAKTAAGTEKLTVTEGSVAVTGATVELTPHLPDFESLVAHQAPVTAQTTGGPLLDAEGNWVGLHLVMVEAAASPGSQKLSYAVPSNRVRALVDELQPGEGSVYKGWEKYHACHRQMDRLARASQVKDHDLPAGSTARRSDDGAEEHEDEGH